MSFHNYYLVNHYYYNLVPMVPAVNKRFFKSFDLISRQCYLVLKPIQVPVLLLLQPNLIHHLTDLVLDWAVFWMVQWYGGRGTIDKLEGPTRPVTVLWMYAL